MNLYLLRHGPAEERDARRYPDDRLRPLTPEGCRKMRHVAAGLRALELDFDTWLVSPYLRARQTAEIVAAACGAKPKLQLADELAPEGGMRRLVRRLAEQPAEAHHILLVGHEPCLGELAGYLLAGKSLPLALKKGGVCLLAVAVPAGPASAVLEWLLTPRQLAALAP